MVYDGRNIAAGEVFDCLPENEPVLMEAGLAEPFYGEGANIYQKIKRRYRRRDLKAEE